MNKFLSCIHCVLAALLFIFPIYLYIIGVCKLECHINFLKNHYWQWWIFGLGVFGVAIIILLMRQKDVYNFNNFKGELKYLIKNGKPAWTLGLAISNIIIALYFFITPLSIVDRFGTSFTIYIGIIAISLGIHYLYEKEAPLRGTMSLLEKLNKDLNNFNSGHLYFVFPALNFGFYTAVTQHNENIFSSDNTFYTNKTSSLAANLYFELFKIIGSDKSIKRKAVIYNYEESNEGGNGNYLKKLYMTYHYMISKKVECQNFIKENKYIELKREIQSLDNDKTVKDCVESAKRISDLFKNENLTKVKPNELIQPVIVVGDIVYVIADYGMPIFDVAEDYFVPIKEENSPVELICWRRTDAALAEQIVNHIDKFIETKRNTDNNNIISS